MKERLPTAMAVVTKPTETRLFTVPKGWTIKEVDGELFVLSPMIQFGAQHGSTPGGGYLEYMTGDLAKRVLAALCRALLEQKG